MALADKPLLSRAKRPKSRENSDLADAPGGPLPARISGAEGGEGRLPRSRPGSRRRGRSDAPADPPLRLRRRDPVLRHPDGALRAGPGSALRGRRGAAPVARLWSTRRLAALELGAGASGAGLSQLWRKLRPASRKPRLSSASPAARGRSRPIWSPARAAATRPRRGGSPIAIRRPSRRSSTPSPALTVDYLSGQIESRRRSGAIVRQLGRKPVAGAVRALGDRSDRAHRRGASRRAIPTCR